jgi:class 3 adenylate cyclase/predicted ATPase
LLDAIDALRADGGAPPPRSTDTGAAPSPPAAPATQAERRQLTVMFVDLVGSTALSGRLDPEDMRDLLRGFQDVTAGEVARFEGHVAKLLGDGVLAYFGWPAAHEDEAERAVRAGLGLVKAVGRLTAPNGEALACRVGIATGLVVVGDLAGEGEARERAVVGETPNLAARLQGLAEPGAVVVAEATRRLLGGLFAYRDLGAVPLKGFAAPVRAFAIAGEGAAESRFEALHAAGLTPLIGREQELALLVDRWQRAREGEGQVVLLAGEPGIGKSRLVRAFRERLGDEPHTALSQFCSPYHTNTALHPVIGLLERAAGLRREDPPEHHLDRLEAMLALATEDVGACAPPLADLLGIPTGGRYPVLELSPQQRKKQIFRALLDQLAGLAARQPVLVVYEDVHWADPTTLELIGRVVEQVQRLAVLVLITFRAEFVPPWAGHGHVTALSLSRLGRRQGGVLVARVAGGKPLPPEVLGQILVRTDGVPLFVEELTKAVLESGLLREEGDRYALTGPLPPLAIPATLQDSLMARLDRLAPIKEVAQVAACLGREFDHAVLAAVSPLPEPALSGALDQLVEAELIFRRGVPPEASYIFKHALVCDAAYQSLLKSRRQQLHGRIASVLEARFPELAETQPEVLAQHCAEAGLTEKAVAYWHQAGKLAAQRSALAEAVTQLHRGLELLPRLSDRAERGRLEVELQVTLGYVLMISKGVAAPEMGTAYGRARTLCRELDDARLEPVALWGMWQYLHNRPDMAAALVTAEELLTWARSRGDVAAEVSGHRSACVTRVFRGDLELALSHADQVKALYDPAQHPITVSLTDPWIFTPWIAARSVSVWALLLLGRPGQAFALSREALSAADADGRPYVRAVVLHQQNVFDQMRGEQRAVEERSAGLLMLTEKHGFPHWHATATILHGWAVATGGAPEAGLAETRRGLAAKQATGAEVKVPYYLGLMAGQLGRMGRAADALALLDDAFTRVKATGERWYEAELHRLRGEALLQTAPPDVEQAAACFREAIEVAQRQSAKWWELRAASSLARLWADQGEQATAHDLLAPVLGWFTEGFDAPDLREAKALLQELASTPLGPRTRPRRRPTTLVNYPG